MNLFEDGQFTNSALVSVQEIRLVLAVLVKALHGVQLGVVVVAVDLVEVAVLVSEHATAAVVADLILIEGTAIFCSELVTSMCCSLESSQFFVSVGELAFLAISAAAGFDPVLAHLGLVFLGLVLVGEGHRLISGAIGGCCWDESRGRRNEFLDINGEFIRGRGLLCHESVGSARGECAGGKGI